MTSEQQKLFDAACAAEREYLAYNQTYLREATKKYILTGDKLQLLPVEAKSHELLKNWNDALEAYEDGMCHD